MINKSGTFFQSKYTQHNCDGIEHEILLSDVFLYCFEGGKIYRNKSIKLIVTMVSAYLVEGK